MNHEREPGSAYETRQRLAHVSEADESYAHRFLRFEIVPPDPMAGAHYTGSAGDPSGRRVIRAAGTTVRVVVSAADGIAIEERGRP